MAHLRGDRPFASLHNFVKMLLSPHHSSKAPQDTEVAEDVDEPPDPRFLNTSHVHVDEGLVYVKSPTIMSDHKESLLTRALKSSPVLSPPEDLVPTHDHSFYRTYHSGNVSGVSTAELTSDGGLTSPSLSNTPSPPLPTQFSRRPVPEQQKGPVREAGESAVEANLGRKRCISFACGRKAEDKTTTTTPQPPAQQPTTKNTDNEPTPTEFKRKTTLTFVCPAREPEPRRERPCIRAAGLRSRPRGSPAPVARKASPEKEASSAVAVPQEKTPSMPQQGVPTRGLGKFEESEATRFHEFASSIEEDDEWVTKVGEYKEKITMSDCMKKENAIRKLGEEAEEEALEDEDEDDDDEDDEEEDDEDADEDSTVEASSDEDDGNESDNEAGFAESDESDEGSEYEFWAPATTTAATSPQTLDVPHPTLPRRDSTTSFLSPIGSPVDEGRRWPPALSMKGPAQPTKIPKMRPTTPHLPDSTDFVCGTLDEDRPLEAAYKSCIEQRRLSKQVVIPQDIDPSFPTSDPENDDDEEEDEDQAEESVRADEAPRGRAGPEPTKKHSPRLSPRRMVSPPPRRQGRMSPKRLRSPPPPMKLKAPAKSDQAPVAEAPQLPPQRVNISELVQRPPMIRTKSLPRAPNPFFTSSDRSLTWTGVFRDSSERESEVHTRGPIDIVEGLEKKRQKRKEKFWRQHCRKAAREQMERRRPLPGRGAERMKDLGLAVAERCRAYGVGEDVQLVLSV